RGAPSPAESRTASLRVVAPRRQLVTRFRAVRRCSSGKSRTVLCQKCVTCLVGSGTGAVIRRRLLGCVRVSPSGRGRDTDCSAPPAQTRAGAFNAHGSYLGCLASKRTFGYG